MEAHQLSSATYAFIEEEILSGLKWPPFYEVLSGFRRNGARPPFVYIDVFPALACQAAGGDPLQAVPLAAAWLLNILAGRIFDDQQDEEGGDRPWVVNGSAEAVSYGLFSLGAANASLSHLNVDRHTLSEIMCAFGNILSLSAKAQTAKLDLSGLTIERYFAHIAAKTGIVFATGAWAGARMSDPKVTDSTVDTLYRFGLNLGMAIQIADDCEDLESSDLYRRHFTLPVVYAISQENHPKHASLIALLENEPSEKWVNSVISLLEEMNAVDWSMRMATVYRAQALAALEPLPKGNIAPLIEYATGKHDFTN